MRQVHFGTVKSYEDLGLFLTDVEISAPEPKRSSISVPGRDGKLVFSLTDDTKFENRTITLTFALQNYRHEWHSIFTKVITALSGRNLEVMIEPDTSYYWEAFCTVDRAKSDSNKGEIVISLDVFPYKKKAQETVYTISAYYTGKTQVCVNSRQQVRPVFHATEVCTLAFGATTKTLEAGDNEFYDISFKEGENEIMITGTGTVTVRYREGTL